MSPLKGKNVVIKVFLRGNEFSKVKILPKTFKSIIFIKRMGKYLGCIYKYPYEGYIMNIQRGTSRACRYIISIDYQMKENLDITFLPINDLQKIYKKYPVGTESLSFPLFCANMPTCSDPCILVIILVPF